MAATKWLAVAALALAAMAFASPPVAADWWDTSWTKRNCATYNYTNGSVANTSVAVNLTYDADMLANFSDVRPISNATNAPVNYWIEEFKESQWAYIWVATPLNDTICWYYGKPSATNLSNGSGVFNFFDDFERPDSTTLGYDWYVDGLISGINNISIRNETLHLYDGSNASGTNSAAHNFSLQNDSAVVMKANISHVNNWTYQYYVSADGNINPKGEYCRFGGDKHLYCMNGAVETSANQTYTTNASNRYEFRLNATSRKLIGVTMNYSYDIIDNFDYTDGASANMSAIAFIKPDSHTSNSSIDYLFVRNFTTPAPAVSFIGEESNVSALYPWVPAGYPAITSPASSNTTMTVTGRCAIDDPASTLYLYTSIFKNGANQTALFNASTVANNTNLSYAFSLTKTGGDNIEGKTQCYNGTFSAFGNTTNTTITYSPAIPAGFPVLAWQSNGTVPAQFFANTELFAIGRCNSSNAGVEPQLSFSVYKNGANQTGLHLSGVAAQIPSLSNFSISLTSSLPRTFGDQIEVKLKCWDGEEWSAYSNSSNVTIAPYRQTFEVRREDTNAQLTDYSLLLNNDTQNGYYGMYYNWTQTDISAGGNWTTPEYMADGNESTYALLDNNYTNNTVFNSSSYFNIYLGNSNNETFCISYFYNCQLSSNCTSGLGSNNYLQILSGSTWTTIAALGATLGSASFVKCYGVDNSALAYGNKASMRLNTQIVGDYGGVTALMWVYEIYNNRTGPFPAATKNINVSRYEMPTGASVKLTGGDNDGFYQNRTYYLTLPPGNDTPFIVYLPRASTSVSAVFEVVDRLRVGVTDALVIAQRSIFGTWTNVSYGLTDISGSTTMYLTGGENYKMYVLYNGILYYGATIVAAADTYTLSINSTVIMNLSSVLLNGITLYTSPDNVTKNSSNSTWLVNFTYNVTSINPVLTHYGAALYCNGTVPLSMENKTSTAYGGLVYYYADIINCTNVTWHYWLNNSYAGYYGTYKFMPVGTMYGAGMQGAFDRLRTLPQEVRDLIGILILTLTAIGLCMFNVEAAAIGELVMGGMLTAGGLLSWPVYLVTFIAALAVIFIRRRY